MKIFADKPIKYIDEDILGREYFVDNLVKMITSYDDESSLTIGLQGKWGTGKTSILNLTQNKLKELDYKIINFNPWNFKGRDDLLHSFFNEMCKRLYIPDDRSSLDLKEKQTKKKRIVLGLLTAGLYCLKKIPVSPVAKILYKVASLIKKYVESLEQPSITKKSLEDLKNEISSQLGLIDKKIVVFIDDVDRLEDLEICEIFKLVNLVGNFNNVIYVLSMDKDVVVSALKNSQNKYALNYMEKIVQLPLSVPDVSSFAIQNVLSKFFKSLCSQYKEELLELRNREFQQIEFLEQFETLRDVNRFINVFYTKYVSIHENIDFHDFCIITLFEIKYPQVYQFIKENKDLLVALSYIDKSKEIQDKILLTTKEIDNLRENDKKFILNALQFLFPKISGIGDSFVPLAPVFSDDAEIKKFIFNENNFDNYFQFNKNTLLYSKNQIFNIIETYSKEEFIKFLIKLNKKKQLTAVMRYISRYVKTDLSQERSAEIISWIMEISSDLKEEDDSPNFSVDLPLESIIPFMIIDYLRAYKQIDVFSFIKKIYTEGKLNNFKLSLIRLLKDEKNTNEFGENPILSENEILEIENLIKNDLKEFLLNEDNLSNKSYIKFYSLMELIDPNACIEILRKFSEKESKINSILNKFFLQNSEGSFCFIKTQKKMEPIYNKIVKEIKPDMDISKRDNIVRIVFVMDYENYNPTNLLFHYYNYNDIKKYLSEVKKENQK